MDLRLPITTIKGEPIEDVGRALPSLIDSLSHRVHALENREPCGRIVLAPCLRRALLPIWIDLALADGPDPPELSPIAAFLVLLTSVERLVDQVDAALDVNWSRSAA